MSTFALRRRLTEAGMAFGVGLLAIVTALLLIALAGGNPSDAATAFIKGAFGSRTAVAGTLSKMVPLVMVALGWIVVYRAGRFHVGFPGQLLIGGMAATIVGLEADFLPTGIHLLVSFCAGALAGGAFAGIVAWLWARRNVNELLATLLLNLVAIQIVSYLVRGPFQEPRGDMPQTAPIPDSSLWPTLLSNTVLKWDLILVPIAVALIAFLLSRTTFGTRIRFVGTNEHAARFAGISTLRVGVNAIVLSGMLAGVAGVSLVLAGEARGTAADFGGSYGFQGIAVALLAYNRPMGVIPAALLFAALRQGGGVMEASVGVSSSLISVTEGIIIVFVLVAIALLARSRQSGGVA